MRSEPHATEANAWKRFWKWWKKIAIRIGTFQARLILTIFYFLLAPFSLIVRLLDPLAIRKNEQPTWLLRESDPGDLLARVQRQS